MLCFNSLNQWTGFYMITASVMKGLKRSALFLGTTFFEYGLKNKSFAILNENFYFKLFLTIQTNFKNLNLGAKLFAVKSGNRCHLWVVLGPIKAIRE